MELPDKKYFLGNKPSWNRHHPIYNAHYHHNIRQETPMNAFRDCYTHNLWNGYISDYPNYMINLSIIAGGRFYQVSEAQSDVDISGFWKRDGYQVYRANKRWDLLNDDPSDIEETYGSWLCHRCGREMVRDKLDKNILRCHGCYNRITA